MTDLIKTFNSIRDIPYKLSLVWGEENLSCIGKHDRFYKKLSENGYNVRYRLCSFLWSDCGLPEELLKTPHSDECVHTFIEVEIYGRWIVVDLTWDKPLASVLPVNEWDGKTDCRLGVNAIEVFSPEKSDEMVKGRTREGFIKSRKENKEFYSALNSWLESVRKRTG